MGINEFINDRISQLAVYMHAVLANKLHYTELDKFIADTMEDWTLCKITDEMPKNAKERVFWYVIHELQLYGAQALKNNLFFSAEMNTCLDFLDGVGCYPIDCIGWRPIP